MANRARPWAVQEVAVRAAEATEKEKQKRAEQAKRRAEAGELERARNYIRKSISFLPLDAYLKTNPVFHRDIADGVYATITLTGADSDAVSALENLARDAMRNNCSFASVNNTVVVQSRMEKQMICSPSEGVYRTAILPPKITYFGTGFYRKKPKSK
jgi:hypothetical protein